MNIRRGMLRAWVVASIAWVTTVGVVTIPDMVPKQAQQTKEIPDEGLTYEEAFYDVPPEKVREPGKPPGRTWDQYTKQKTDRGNVAADDMDGHAAARAAYRMVYGRLDYPWFSGDDGNV